MSRTPAPTGHDASCVDPSPSALPTSPAARSRAGCSESYAPPAVTRLGSLRDLTLGGMDSPDDGSGGAGDGGTFGLGSM